MRVLNMCSIVSAAAAALVLLLPATTALVPSQRQSVGLWPLPQWFERNGTDPTLFVDARSFEFRPDTATVVTASLAAILRRYRGLMFLHGTGNATGAATAGHGTPSVLTSCAVSVASADEKLALNMAENYDLRVSADEGCAITAPNFVGALRALETLSQLVLADSGALMETAPTYFLPGAPWHIVDAPRFAWRGLMVDTSRHFLPLNALRRQVDAMSYSKMNVLHWHISDAQSFPFKSEALPNLTQGAFSPRAVYTSADVKQLAEYARVRGVNVVVEVDMPGHSFAMTMGYPHLGVNCSAMYPLETQFWTGGLNPAVEAVYPFLSTLLQELMDLVPGSVFHLGGDEVQQQCWSGDPTIQAYLRAHDITIEQLYEQFLGRMMDTVTQLGRRPMMWDSLFLSNASAVPTNAIVHAYPHGGAGTGAAVAKAGRDVVVSTSQGDYLAHQVEWDVLFTTEVMPPNLTAAEQAHVLGGEACMWGERMDDSDIDTMVWVGTASVAERTWSPGKSPAHPDAFNTTAAVERLIPHRCRLYQRGIRAKPVDARDTFGRRRLQNQCELVLPAGAMAASLPPLSATFTDELW